MSAYTVRSVSSRGVRGPARRIRIDTPPTATPPVLPEPPGDYPEDGTVDDVLQWVDEAADTARPARAKAAIVAEHGRSKPRTTLLTQLNERTG